MFKRRGALSLGLMGLVLASFSACSNTKTYGDSSFFRPSQKQDSTISDARLTNLVQTVLSHPGIVRFSKLEYILEKHKKVYVSFASDVVRPNRSTIHQNDVAVEVVDFKTTFENPCYVFKRIDISGNTAHILLYFDITGFVADGDLTYIDGKWVPNKNFTIGYR
jgi:hypothetical protein